MTEMIVIELPLPHKNLSPNSRCHWAAKARSVAKARSDARIMATQAKLPSCPWAKATIRFEFTFRTNAKHDDDNLAASCKSYRDGIADAGIVADDNDLMTLPVVVLPKNAKHPGLRITITEGIHHE
tara:strand:+ start:67 stop:444 length:378 start_codon:yes stop_codon:yes gene_type:complete